MQKSVSVMRVKQDAALLEQQLGDEAGLKPELFISFTLSAANFMFKQLVSVRGSRTETVRVSVTSGETLHCVTS